MTKAQVRLSRRAGRIFDRLDLEDQRRLRDVLMTAPSFEDLPAWARDMIIHAETIRRP